MSLKFAIGIFLSICMCVSVTAFAVETDEVVKIPPSVSPTTSPLAPSAPELVTVPQSSAPESATLLPVASATPTPVNDFLNNIKIGGLVDFYYLYDFNLPAPATTGNLSTSGAAPKGNVVYMPYTYADQFTLNMAMLSIKKDADPVGFRLDLAYGPETSMLSSGGTSLDSTTSPIAQAYLIYKGPYGITVTAGKFNSLVGFESHYANENFNYTFSYGHIWAAPLWHEGVILSRDFGSLIEADIYVVNGWSTFYENNASKSVGARLKLNVIDRLKVTLGVISGNETPVGGADQKTSSEAIIDWKVFSALQIAIDGIYSFESHSGGNLQQVSSGALYAKYLLNSRIYFAARYEMYYDDALFSSGLRTSNPNPATAQTINSYTGTADFKAAENLHFKLELRTDKTNGTVFPFADKSGVATSSQTLGLVAATLAF